MSDEQIEPDIRPSWELVRSSDGSYDRFRLKANVVATFVEPTRDEVRTALLQILDEALGPNPTEIAGWGDAGSLDLERSELPATRTWLWKQEAMEILDVVDSCHDALPDPFKAKLGGSKIYAILSYIHGSQTD